MILRVKFVIADTTVVERVIPAIAGARDNNEGRSKVSSSTSGKAKTVVVAGSGVLKKGLSREWVKTRRDENGFRPSVSYLIRKNGIFPPTGSSVSSGTAVKLTGEAGGPIAVFSQPTSDLGCSTPHIPAPGDKISILGLGDKDFPLIRPLSDSGTSREASKFGDGSVKTRANS